MVLKLLREIGRFEKSRIKLQRSTIQGTQKLVREILCKENENWFKNSRVFLRNRGFEKSGLYCTIIVNQNEQGSGLNQSYQ